MTTANQPSPQSPSADDPSSAALPTVLSWRRLDAEQRLGFSGARFTRVNTPLSLLVATTLSVAFYAVVANLEGVYLRQMFCERGPVPYAIVFLFSWSLAILFFKWRKLRLQRRALSISLCPEDEHFVLSPTTVDDVMRRLYERVEEPQRFVVFNRVLVALSNLRNLGRVGDVDDILRTQADHDESILETSYALVRGFVWAIPVLGFIGTVLGLSAAIGSFGGVLGESSEMTDIAISLREVTAGLAVAFETTLEALVAALILQLLATFLRKSEEEFLDGVQEYCQQQIVNRLRMTPFEPIET